MKGWILIALLVVIDQITKFLVKNVDIGIIHYQANYGAAFSLFQGLRWVFIIVAVIVLVIIAVYYNKARVKWPLILLAAGTLGNMIDRVFYGFVIDFINIRIWPVFNIADSLNLIGAIGLVYYLIKKEI